MKIFKLNRKIFYWIILGVTTLLIGGSAVKYVFNLDFSNNNENNYFYPSNNPPDNKPKVDPTPKVNNPGNSSGPIKDKPQKPQNSANSTLFSELFSNESILNDWIMITPNFNGNGFDIVSDDKYGSVLRIRKTNPDGDILMTKSLNGLTGQNCRLRAVVKCIDIKRGAKEWMRGSVCLKFTINNIVYYEAIQNLERTTNWSNSVAHNDSESGKNLDDTPAGEFAFKIPSNASDVQLSIGLQQCTGIMYVSNITIEKVD